MNLVNKRIMIPGGNGLLGRALTRALFDRGCKEVYVPKHKDFDFTRSKDAAYAYHTYKPDVVFNLCVKFGGIVGNSKHPGDFFYSNMTMGINLIEEARKFGVEKFVQIGTQCSYSSDCPVPFKEEDLWKGYPQENNASYGIAKRALATMIRSYRQEFGLNGIYLIPCNMYGENDNFHPVASHVVPGLIRKFVDAKEKNLPFVELWGTGLATRELLYTGDAARALILAAENYDSSDPVNIGTGIETDIASLAGMIQGMVGYDGKIRFSNNGLDGQMKRCNDNSNAEKLFGFKAKTDLFTGLYNTIEWYMNNRDSIREVIYE